MLCLKNCITFTVLAESDAITLPDSVIWDETTADTAMLDESSALRTTESLKSDEEETSHIKNGQVSNIEERSEKAEENVSEAIRDIEPNADILSNGTDLSNGKAEDNKRAQSEMQCENITQGNEKSQSEAESVDSSQDDEKNQSEQYDSEDNQGCEKVQPGAESLDVSDSTTIQLEAESGMAAEAGGSITFILCDVDAPKDSFLSRSGKIVLDTCKAADMPDGAEIKTRKAQPFLN